MPFNESFRPKKYIDEREAFELTGKARRLREIVPSNFDGPIAEWAAYREATYSDFISPVMTFPEEINGDVHRVSWVFHSGLDFESGQPFTNHHLACDCCLMAELSGEPVECDVMQKTLKRRAAFWRSELKLDKILRTCQDAEEGRKKVTLDRNFFAAETIVWMLAQDQAHPESWLGNVTSGEHSVRLLSLVLQEPADSVRALAEDLAEAGRLEYDGEEIVRLAA